MKGHIKYRKDGDRYYVQWGDYKVYRYKGHLCRDGEVFGLSGAQIANKLLALIQNDFEANPDSFRIEKYTDQRVNTIPYLKEWLEAVKSTLSPATYKDYLNSINNHLVPWFKRNPYDLHEIRYDTLCSLLAGIKREGKGKLNVMYCLRACLDYAWKAERIMAVPPFPERRLYGISKKKIKWITEDRQVKIIQAIPKEHQPIFWWLKYHLRRPSEAMALHKEDYDTVRDCFTIRRTFSSKQLVEYTKTHTEHIVPCHPEFRPILLETPVTFSHFFFTNPKSKLPGKHYQHDYLVDLWNKACEETGESINMYAGLKHSSCSQFINEKGGTVDELQMLTDHARRDSVLKYADVELERKRELMGRVLVMKTARKLPEEKQ
jgi:integrase